MGFFDSLFSKEKSEQKFVNRHVRRLLNKYGQKEIREDAMHALAQKGTPEAITGLLQRFTYDHPDSIVDEREKNKIIALLEMLGAERSTEPVRQFIGDDKQMSLSMALIALDTLEGEEATIDIVVEQLRLSDPNDAWTSERKLQLISHLDNIDLIDPPVELVKELVRFLDDLDDDVIFRCLALLEDFGKDEDIRASVVELLLREETSMRIRARILDVARNRKWYLGDVQKELQPNLPEGYYFDKRGNLKFRDPYQ